MTTWTADAAWKWYDARPWLCGFNYLPRYAVNFTEFWQSDSFDERVIAEELTWARDFGFNTCRVNFQFLLWQYERDVLLRNIEAFLRVAHARGISTMLCFFDDCAFSGKQPYLGAQDPPRPGIHNSGCTPSPGHARVTDTSSWPALEDFVRGVIREFARDERVLAWDLYNEPGNEGMGEKSLPLVEACFEWARAESPSQPLTVGSWNYSESFARMNARAEALSDVVSFHSYEPLETLTTRVAALRAHNRPLLCTEWMARTRGSRFETHLPYFKRERIACYSWGLVNGKTQTHFPWRHKLEDGEPAEWFHDVLRADGSAYREAERELVRAAR